MEKNVLVMKNMIISQVVIDLLIKKYREIFDRLNGKLLTKVEFDYLWIYKVMWDPLSYSDDTYDPIDMTGGLAFVTLNGEKKILDKNFKLHFYEEWKKMKNQD